MVQEIATYMKHVDFPMQNDFEKSIENILNPSKNFKRIKNKHPKKGVIVFKKEIP